MRALWIAVVFAAALLTGCGDLPSVQALANKENTVFDPGLVGAWNSGDAVVIVQAGNDQSYRIHWLGAEDAEGTETPRIVRMEGRLAKIGDQRILDLTASNPRRLRHSLPRLCSRPSGEGGAEGSVRGFEMDSRPSDELARKFYAGQSSGAHRSVAPD